MTTAFDNPELFAALLRQSVPVSSRKNQVWMKRYLNFRVDGAYERMNIIKKMIIANDNFMEAEFYIPYMFKFVCKFAVVKGRIDSSAPFVSTNLTLINKTTMDDAEHYLTMARLNA